MQPDFEPLAAPGAAQEPGPAPAVRVPELDGLRGMAISMVMAFHFTGWISPQLQGTGWVVPTQVAAYGWMGVDLFFVLSGFLITSILLRTKGRAKYYLTFCQRRALRIFPVYYAFLLATFCLFAAYPVARDHFYDAYRFQAIHWIYAQNWIVASFPVPAPNLAFLAHFWSLAIEEQFYLVWPLLVRHLQLSTLRRVCIALVVSSPLIRLFAIGWDSGLPGQRAAYFATFCRMDCLAIGSLLAVSAYVGLSRGRIAKWCKAALLVALPLMAGIVIHDPWHSAWQNLPMLTLGLSLTAISAAAIAGLALVSDPDSGMRRLLRVGMLRRLGKYSYGLYVLHWPVAVAVGSWLASRSVSGSAYVALFLVSALPATAGLAWLSWNILECRFLAMKGRLPD